MARTQTVLAGQEALRAQRAIIDVLRTYLGAEIADLKAEEVALDAGVANLPTPTPDRFFSVLDEGLIASTVHASGAANAFIYRAGVTTVVEDLTGGPDRFESQTASQWAVLIVFRKPQFEPFDYCGERIDLTRAMSLTAELYAGAIQHAITKYLRGEGGVIQLSSFVKEPPDTLEIENSVNQTATEIGVARTVFEIVQASSHYAPRR